MKAQVLDLKSKLELLESTLREEIEIKGEEKKDLNVEDKLKEILKTQEGDIVRINVGGQHFATRMETILNVKDNLFHKMLVSKKFDFTKEIFIDRAPELFPFVLDYLRYKKCNLKRLTSEQIADFKEDVIYYELLSLEKELDKSGETLEYVKVEVNKYYYDSQVLVGCMDPKSLLDKDLNTGICTDTPGMILLELNKEVDFDSLEIGGYTGRSDWTYSAGYGAGARIETSVDKKSWKQVGVIPSGYGTTILSTPLTRSKAKYIRFSGESWVAIGYLKLKNIY